MFFKRHADIKKRRMNDERAGVKSKGPGNCRYDSWGANGRAALK
jgi:hypothetical protein